MKTQVFIFLKQTKSNKFNKEKKEKHKSNKEKQRQRRERKGIQRITYNLQNTNYNIQEVFEYLNITCMILTKSNKDKEEKHKEELITYKTLQDLSEYLDIKNI